MACFLMMKAFLFSHAYFCSFNIRGCLPKRKRTLMWCHPSRKFNNDITCVILFSETDFIVARQTTFSMTHGANAAVLCDRRRALYNARGVSWQHVTEHAYHARKWNTFGISNNGFDLFSIEKHWCEQLCNFSKFSAQTKHSYIQNGRDERECRFLDWWMSSSQYWFSRSRRSDEAPYASHSQDHQEFMFFNPSKVLKMEDDAGANRCWYLKNTWFLLCTSLSSSC